MKSMLTNVFPILRVITMVAGVTATGATMAETPAGEDMAVKEISQLSEAELDLTTPGGKSFLQKIAPEAGTACAVPNDNRPDFDQVCSWALDAAETGFDILIGIKDNRIVSFVSPFTPEKDDLWECKATLQDVPESDMKTCSIRSASPDKRQHWASSWASYLDSIN
ncbi:Hypothetical protein OINT_2001713 [Brucella intermedia LMG 3301]|nr:Hypothetical protein OINT_2001713 [Brucella intermedia LMG 3301]